MAHDRRLVVVVAPAGPDGTALVQLVRSSGDGWGCEQVTPDDVGRRSDVIAGALAIVMGTDPASSQLLASFPPGVPVIAFGESFPSSPKPVSWFPRPSAAVLHAVLSETLAPDLIPPPPRLPRTSAPPPSSASTVWRRKTDMIIGNSVAIRGVLDALQRIASSPTTVTITGASGTGKELVASALHYSSPRAAAPFIALNCAAIPESLFEAELFGYVRGAFTGAVATRVGAFEAAHQGTLFLDEIGEMPRALQPKLLRVLERGEITRLGANETRNVAVRVVAATNRNLEEEVRLGNFREDLYYRLRVCHVHIPPLRERLEDVAALVAHHLSIIAARDHRATVPRLSSEALQKLLAHRWPGNVRELVNVLEAAVLLAPGDVVDATHLHFMGNLRSGPSSTDDGPALAYREAKARFDAEYYERLLRAAHGNISMVAKLAQKTRKEVYDALRRAGVDADAYRDDDTA
ncbi:MAG TPA: sigma-54 dependent transcriptional regulator [Labilithrix sp.]|nr:sigma-54 dependent transcriptional regulator [Labilithrix sp.]